MEPWGASWCCPGVGVFLPCLFPRVHSPPQSVQAVAVEPRDRRAHTGHLPVCRGALSPRLQGRGFWRWALSHQASPPSKGQHVVPVPPRGPTTARSWAGLGDRVGDVTEHSGVLWCIIAVSSSCNSCVPAPPPPLASAPWPRQTGSAPCRKPLAQGGCASAGIGKESVGPRSPHAPGRRMASCVTPQPDPPRLHSGVGPFARF